MAYISISFYNIQNCIYKKALKFQQQKETLLIYTKIPKRHLSQGDHMVKSDIKNFTKSLF